jgi:hypothetical protein
MLESTNPVQEPLYRNRRKCFRINGGSLRIQCSATAAKLVGVLAGVNPAGGTYPVATVVISGGGASDQTDESPEAKASVGWERPGQLQQARQTEQIDRS